MYVFDDMLYVCDVMYVRDGMYDVCVMVFMMRYVCVKICTDMYSYVCDDMYVCCTTVHHYYRLIVRVFEEGF